MNLTDAQRGYVAGIIDGEGCVQAHVRKCGQLALRVEVGNTDQRLADGLLETLGGRVQVYTSKRERQRPIYMWRLGKRQDAARLLEEILPLLVVKRRQAEMFIELVGTRGSEDRLRLVTEIKADKRRVA